MMLLKHSDTSRKPGDSFRQQHERWRRAYAEAPCLRERFPDIEQIVLELTFVDAKALGTYSPQMHRFLPPAKAFFGLPCPRTLCLDGGFDLDAIVADMIAHGTDAAEGTLECGGKISLVGADHPPCLLRMDYRFEIAYAGTRPKRRKSA